MFSTKILKINCQRPFSSSFLIFLILNIQNIEDAERIKNIHHCKIGSFIQLFVNFVIFYRHCLHSLAVLLRRLVYFLCYGHKQCLNSAFHRFLMSEMSAKNARFQDIWYWDIYGIY